MAYQFKCPFHCTQPDKITKITLSIKSNNYFKCFLNGKEVTLNKAPTACEYIDLIANKCNLQSENNEFIIELQQISDNDNDYMLFMAELILE